MAHGFDPTRAIQAAAHLIKEHEGEISSLRLLKLLYIAERECLAEHLEPLLGDDMAAMEHGPVLCEVYNMLKDESMDSPQWNEHIVRVGRYQHLVKKDPGVGRLSRFEIEKLSDIG